MGKAMVSNYQISLFPNPWTIGTIDHWLRTINLQDIHRRTGDEEVSISWKCPGCNRIHLYRALYLTCKLDTQSLITCKLAISISYWWFGTWVLFPSQLGMSSSQLTRSYFSEGLKPTTNQIYIYIYIYILQYTIFIYIYIYSYIHTFIYIQLYIF